MTSSTFRGLTSLKYHLMFLFLLFYSEFINNYESGKFWRYLELVAEMPEGVSDKARFDFALDKTESLLTDVDHFV